MGWVRFPVGSYRRLEKRCLRPVHCPTTASCLALMGGVQGNNSRAVLSLTCHQCSIHCESTRVVHGASKLRWGPQTSCGTPGRSRKATKYLRFFLMHYLFTTCTSPNPPCTIAGRAKHILSSVCRHNRE